MADMFGGGGSARVPDIPVAEPAPEVSDKAVQEAVAEALRRRKRSRGFRATILASKDENQNAPGGGALQQTLGA
jgi:hypothetical protein